MRTSLVDSLSPDLRLFVDLISNYIGQQHYKLRYKEYQDLLSILA